MSTGVETTSGPRPAGSATTTLRRVIVYLLLFIVMAVAATGVGGLLDRLFTEADVLAETGSSSLALPLALTLVGGPLAVLLFRALWARLHEPPEHSSAAWGLYVSGMYLLSLLVSTSYVFGSMAALAAGEQGSWKNGLGYGLAWASIWVWHRWMWAHPSRGPLSLSNIPPVLGSVLGLVLVVGASVGLLGSIFERVLEISMSGTSLGTPWWLGALGLLVWVAGGMLVWWWHWFHVAAKKNTSALANVALVGIGIGATAVVCLWGAGYVLYALLRFLLERDGFFGEVLGTAPLALAALLIGALAWNHHGSVLGQRPGTVNLAARLVISAVALAAAASGIGVIINAALAVGTTNLGGTPATTLLLAGISSLAIGGPLWWLAWRPTHPADPDGRRIYLVAVFGASALVALITLLVLGYRLLERLLGDAPGGLLEHTRAPLGLLVATVLVAAYHFGLWRHDRTLAPARPSPTGLRLVTLVAGGGDGRELAAEITARTGARVTVLSRQDGHPGSVAPARVLQALDGLTAGHVLLLAGPGDRLEAIELSTHPG